jgi:hypothetical protein
MKRPKNVEAIAIITTDVGRLEIIGPHILEHDIPESNPLFHRPPPTFSFSFFMASDSTHDYTKVP